MPLIKPRPDEDQKDFLNRCMANEQMNKEFPDSTQRYAVCNSQWKNKGTDMTAIKTRTTFKQRTARFIADPMSIPKIRRDVARREGAIAAVAVKGDQFWNSGKTKEFSTSQGLSEGYKTMDRTFHDLDHGADPHSPSGMHIRIEDIVGYHDFTEWDANNKEMIIYIYPHEDMPAYKTWQAFLDLCSKADKTPNISVEYFSKDEQVKASELGENVDYKSYGFNDDDLIWVERSYQFIGAATVNIGACNDKDGCGLLTQSADIRKVAGVITASYEIDEKFTNGFEKDYYTQKYGKWITMEDSENGKEK